MAATFYKGDIVYLFGDWDGKGTIYFQKLVVMSWGVKAATASKMVDNKMIKARIYPQHVNQSAYGVHIFRASPGFDPEAKALELSAAYIKWALEQNQSKVGSSAYHQPSVLAKIEQFSAAKPSCLAR